MVGRGDLQETTRLIGEAPSVVEMFVIKLWMWMCGSANPNFIKKWIIFLFTVKQLVKLVIDIGREFKILGPW